MSIQLLLAQILLMALGLIAVGTARPDLILDHGLKLLMGLGLTLFLVTLMLNIIAHRIVQTYREQYN